MTQQSPAPGWYPDPSNPSLQRYWDGSGWRAPESSPPRPTRNNNREAAIGIGVVVLVVIGLVMTMQSVSLMTGSGQIWTGVGMVGAGTALAFFMGAKKTIRVVAAICLAFALINAFYIESQMNEKRNQISEIFDN